MSSISEIDQRSPAGVQRAAPHAVDCQSLLRRWLLFSDHGVAAQRHMAVVWSCILACGLADAVWLPCFKLSFVASNWASLAQDAGCFALVGVLVALAFHRLRNDGSRIGTMLRAALLTTELLYRVALPFGTLLIAGATLSYVITAADLPLRDSLLARIDHRLRFDWLYFLGVTNSSPFVVGLLRHSYEAIGFVIEVVVVWFALVRNGERLAEFLAILSLCTAGLCVSMLLAPAAGAFAYYGPAPELFKNYSEMGGMWTFGHTFNMLRDGSLLVIDLSALDGIVSFPSFHTVLGVIAIYAVRDIRWLLGFILPVNATMIVATMPVGGHHLTDVLAGAALTFAAILIVRQQKKDVPAPS